MAYFYRITAKAAWAAVIDVMNDGWGIPLSGSARNG